jgi:hypothetical protein
MSSWQLAYIIIATINVSFSVAAAIANSHSINIAALICFTAWVLATTFALGRESKSG